jgi:hypothetical protein
MWKNGEQLRKGKGRDSGARQSASWMSRMRSVLDDNVRCGGNHKLQ